jgi:hypothetical protein
MKIALVILLIIVFLAANAGQISKARKNYKFLTRRDDE